MEDVGFNEDCRKEKIHKRHPMSAQTRRRTYNLRHLVKHGLFSEAILDPLHGDYLLMENRMYHLQNTVPIVHQIWQAQSMSTLHPFPVANGDGDSQGHEVPSSRPHQVHKKSFSIHQPGASAVVQWHVRHHDSPTEDKSLQVEKC